MANYDSKNGKITILIRRKYENRKKHFIETF